MKTLLFVDDEPKVLQGLQRQLRPMRHEWDMNFAENASQALEFMSARPVDIVVSDMMMPGMDGSELLKAIIQLRPQTVRIILSGHSDREAVLRLVGPAHQYISKPCDADELRRAIERDFSLVVRLVKQVLRAGRWAEENRAAAIAYVAKETRSSESAVVRAYGKDVNRHLRTDLAESSIVALGDFTKFLAEWKFIPSDFNVRAWIDPRPLQQALRELADDANVPTEQPSDFAWVATPIL